MSEEVKKSNQKALISRRQMLAGTGAAIAAGAVVSPALLSATAMAETQKSATSGVPLHDQIWDFEKQPSPVPDSQIKQTLECEILIVGTGASGMPCIAAAIETGAKVIAIEKLPKLKYDPSRPDLSRAIGAWFGFAGGRLYEKRGVKLNLGELASAQAHSALWRCDQRQINKIIKCGPKVADWWLDILEEQGIDPETIPIETHPEMKLEEKRPGTFVNWQPTGLIIPAGRAEHAFEKHINDNGFEITYETSAHYLIKEGGRITGIIAKNPQGYLKIKASKAVIICTGGFEGNNEMIKKYLPEAGEIKEIYGKKTNTGDGFQMMKWAGARMDPWPLCPMTWDGMNPEALKLGYDFVGVARQAWLYVNAFGQRFMNEDATFAAVGKSMYMQPRAMMWTIFDERWRDDDVLEKMAGTVCRRMTTRRIPFVLPFNTKEANEKLIAAGIIIKGNTLEELAAKMNQEGPKLGIGNELDVDTFKATVARYNELAHKGVDEDFYKDPQKFFALDKPPYYAVRTTVGILVAQGGALVNDNFQVVDKSGKAIPGLYACGNVAGGFNAFEFDMIADIGSLGRGCVSGYLAAKHAAGVKV
jgi:fumarate reductase flavoprotein subunit